MIKKPSGPAYVDPPQPPQQYLAVQVVEDMLLVGALLKDRESVYRLIRALEINAQFVPSVTATPAITTPPQEKPL